MAKAIASCATNSPATAGLQIQPGKDFSWTPKAGQVACLIARYDGDTVAIGPAGWTYVREAKWIDRRGDTERLAAGSLWWFELPQDYLGWRHAGYYRYETEGDLLLNPETPEQLFEMPSVIFASATPVELELWVMDERPAVGGMPSSFALYAP